MLSWGLHSQRKMVLGTGKCKKLCAGTSGHITQGWSNLLRTNMCYIEYQVVSSSCVFWSANAYAVLVVVFTIFSITLISLACVRKGVREGTPKQSADCSVSSARHEEGLEGHFPSRGSGGVLCSWNTVSRNRAHQLRRLERKVRAKGH